MINIYSLSDQEAPKQLEKECLTHDNSLDHNFLNLDIVYKILEGKSQIDEQIFLQYLMENGFPLSEIYKISYFLRSVWKDKFLIRKFIEKNENKNTT